MSAKPFTLDRVSHSFGSLQVLRDLSLAVFPEEFIAIVGPSGCGKTTLLNLLSGFDQATSGTVQRNGRIRMVYQQDGLFPWQTVGGNIGLGLRHIKSAAQRKQQTEESLALIGLEKFEQHYPHQLSGGMRQRVELARALAGDSDVLLMDEPFSSLDYLTRLRMRDELARILHERPRTVILVTHDIEEAAQLADRVIVLSERPASIRDELRVTTPRPRGPTQSDVINTVHLVLTKLNAGQETEDWAGTFQKKG